MMSRELTVLGISGSDHARSTVKFAASVGTTSTGNRSHRDGPESVMQIKSLADEITDLFDNEGNTTMAYEGW